MVEYTLRQLEVFTAAAEQESLGRTFTKRGGHQLRGAR